MQLPGPKRPRGNARGPNSTPERASLRTRRETTTTAATAAAATTPTSKARKSNTYTTVTTSCFYVRSSHGEVLRKASLFSNPDHNDQDAERKKQEELEQQQIRKESYNKARAEFQQQQQE